MRVVSLNGWGGKLHEPLCDWLRETRPDILCLQEVVHSPAATRDWLTYRDGDHILPQRANFFADIRAALPDHHATFCPGAEGTLWDGDREVASQWGLASFVDRRLAVTAQVQGFVHGRYSPDGYGAHPRSRSGHAFRFYLPGRGFVALAQMHGLRDLAGKHDTPARAAQARRFLDLLNRVAEPGDLRIACGDFNVGPESETLAILANAGLQELVTEGGHEGTRTSHYRKSGRFADYMLIDRGAAYARFEVVRDPEVSDHCPLVLDL